MAPAVLSFLFSARFYFSRFLSQRSLHTYLKVMEPTDICSAYWKSVGCSIPPGPKCFVVCFGDTKKPKAVLLNSFSPFCVYRAISFARKFLDACTSLNFPPCLILLPRQQDVEPWWRQCFNVLLISLSELHKNQQAVYKETCWRGGALKEQENSFGVDSDQFVENGKSEPRFLWSALLVQHV